MTPTQTHQSEADQLRERITEAEQRHAEAVRAWREQAAPIQERINEYRRRSDHKKEAAARLDLDNLEPCPDEPVGLWLLRGRLARLES